MAAPPLAAGVLALQRAAGNRAVAGSLAQRVLARYETPEHVDIGDRHAVELGKWIGTEAGRAWVTKYGLADDVRGLDTDWYALGKRKIGSGPMTLSPGEIIALSGDFYESWAELAGAPAGEVREILAALHQERAGKLANANATYEEITRRHRDNAKDHYLELAKRNTPHFTPGNRRQWRKMHVEALELARRKPVGRGAFSAAQFADPGAAHDDDFEKALFIDAAAGHFLTDAFAAGHLFDKTELEAAIAQHLRAHPARPANPEMGAYLGVVAAAGATDLLVLKNVHDRMNREGFDVSNARGMRWKTYGDQFLAKATDTQRIAALAIYVSRRQVYAARAGGNPDPAAVEAFLPDAASVRAATDYAISCIPAAADDIAGLVYRQRSMAPTQFGPILGGIIESNIQTIGAPGRERQLLEIQERAERTRTPQVAPQFTITSW